MKEEKFKVINYIRNLLVVIDNELDNFPKKDIEIKNRIRNNSYELLEIVYYANNIQDRLQKKNMLDQAIAKIKILDFLINLCYDKKIINTKKYIKFGNKMDEIIKYLIGWKNSLNNTGNS